MTDLSETGNVRTSPYVRFWHTGEMTAPEEALIAWARAQRLLPLLGWRAEREGWTLPAALREATQVARYRQAARQTLVDRQLGSLATRARETDLAVAVVKGPVVGEAYPAPGLRPYDDIDLFVPDATTAILVDAIEDLGYRSMLLGVRTPHLPPMRPLESGLRVEIHRLPYHRFSFAPLQPWQAYPGFQTPEPVQHFVYLVQHAVARHELRSGLLHLIDLRFWTETWEPESWERARVLAEELGYLRAVGLALALLPFAWPDETVSPPQALFPAPPQAILEAGMRAMFGHDLGLMPHIGRDVQEHNIRGWLRYMTLILLGDPQTRRGLPWTEKAWFYVQRPFRLLENYGPLLLRLLRGDRQSRKVLQRQRDLMDWLRGAE